MLPWRKLFASLRHCNNYVKTVTQTHNQTELRPPPRRAAPRSVVTAATDQDVRPGRERLLRGAPWLRLCVPGSLPHQTP